MKMHSELRKHIIDFLNKGLRLDGRAPLEYRKPIKVEYDISKSAEGSARVQIGGTLLMAGIKLSLEKPYPDTPDAGNLMCGAELIPMANPEFELGAPGLQAIELGRIVDRGIRESHVIDTKKLCITPGEKVWGISIDLIPINDSGNLFDASALAALAALKNTRLPKLENEKIDYLTRTDEPLPLSDAEPVSVTVCKIGSHFIIDPTEEEEKVIDARLTVASMKDGTLCALQKGGEETLTSEDIDKMIGIAVEKANELRAAL
jgi:exosome complex component RRP42